MIKCPKCFLEYDDNLHLCPYCGSENHSGAVFSEITFKTRIYGKLSLVKRVGKRKRPSLEIEAGEQPSASTNTYVTKTRIIDRENDIYKEIITDSITGEVIHREEGPLSKHNGHGTDKYSKEQ